MKNNYQGLNVLNNKTRSAMPDITNIDTIDEVANMIKSSGASRGERRRLEKALAKTNKLSAKALQKAQSKVNMKAYEEYREIAELDFVHFNAILGLVMCEDYHWKEKDSEEHGQLFSLFDRIQAKMKKYNKLGYSTKQVCERFEEVSGIMLMTDKGFIEDDEEVGE